MKKINQLYIAMLLSLLIIAGLPSCKKDGYLTDGGVSKATTSLSTYDYLKNNQYHQFDTVITLIDHYKLKDTINSAKTFFAFTDIDVHQLMITLRVTSLSQLTDSVSSKLFKQYIFSNTITLDGASLTAVPYTNIMGSSVPCAIKKISSIEYLNLTNSALAINYFTLQYVKVNGVLDGSAGAPDDDPVDVVLSCQTTGIQTSTGTTLHVFNNNSLLTH